MKVKAKDLKQGRVVYQVHILLFLEIPTTTIERMEVLGKPSTGRSRSKFVSLKDSNGFFSRSSLLDRNLPLNDYNLHKFFWTYKEAKRYVDRIESGCLSKRERHILDSAKLSRIEDSIYYNHNWMFAPLTFQ